MGGAACPLHDPGNDRSIERGSDLQAARRGSLTTPAKPAGERESDAALTPRSVTRSSHHLSIKHGNSQLQPTAPVNNGLLYNAWVTAYMLDQLSLKAMNNQTFGCPQINVG